MIIHWAPLTLLCGFVLADAAVAQNNIAPVATNKPAGQVAATNVVVPGQTNITPPAPPITVDPSDVPDETSSLSNLYSRPLVEAPSPPPVIGPNNTGNPLSISPIMGMSALSGPSFPAEQPILGPGIPLWGPVSIHPLLNYTFLYGRGIVSAPGQADTTAINTVSPGFILGLGDYWTLEYEPSISVYSSRAFKNTVDQNAILRGSSSNEVWALNFSQSYVKTSDPLIETGQQTTQQGFATTIEGLHQIGNASSIDLSVNQNFRYADLSQGLSDLREWNTMDWYNYQVIQQLAAGIGLTVGYDNSQPGPDMPFEQLQGRLNFRFRDKLLIVLTGGAEDRQFLGPDEPAMISPVFMGLLRYQPFDSTIITLQGSRQVTPSLFVNQVEVVTAAQAGITQVLTPKLTVELSGSYSTTPFTSIVPGALPPYYIGAPPVTPLTEVRSDRLISGKIDFGYKVTSKTLVSIFYTLGEDTTAQANFKYTTSQIGLAVNYRY